jgi:hypothetical protein
MTKKKDFLDPATSSFAAVCGFEIFKAILSWISVTVFKNTYYKFKEWYAKRRSNEGVPKEDSSKEIEN